MKRLLPFAAVLAVSASALAREPSWPERAGGAGLVVLGRCESQESRWEDGAIHTYSELSVRRLLRGDAGTSVLVRQPGGVVDGIGQKVTHVTRLEGGRPYLLFLVRDRTGAWTPSSQGVHGVESGPDGIERVAGEALEAVAAEIESAR